MSIELPPRDEAAAAVAAGHYCGPCVLRPAGAEAILDPCDPQMAAVTERIASPQVGEGYNLHTDTGPFCPMRQVPLPGGGVVERSFVQE